MLMVDKLLAFAGVTAVTGLALVLTVGGCSSSADPGPTETVDAGPDVRKPPPRPDFDDAGDLPPEACGPTGQDITSADLDGEIGWKPPAAPQRACSAEDITAIEKATGKSASSYLDFVAGVSDECKACVVSTKESENWGPIVTFNEEGTNGIANFGACYAAVDKPECGKAMEYLQLCVASACQKCSTAGERNECTQEAAQTKCKTITAEMQTACTNKDVDAKCRALVDGIKYLCGGGGVPDDGP
jgi:hypothetical protein